MFDNKIKKKLEKLLSDIDPKKLAELTEMIKSGESLEKNIDFEKASKVLKSLNLENEITPDMLTEGLNKLRENPDILSGLGKKKE